MRNQNNKGYFSVHRTMLNHWLFEDATEIGLWVTFASEFAYEECEVKGKFTGKPIKLKPNQQVFSTDQLGQLLNKVWPGTKSGKKRLTRHMVNLRMNKWKAIGLIDWIDCDCRTDGRLFTIKKARPNLGETEAVSETKPAAPNIKKKANKTNTNTSRAKKFTPPTYAEVLAYAEEKGWSDGNNLADKFFEYYDGTGWIKEKVGKPVLNWKLTMCDWNSRRSDQPEVKVVKRTGKSTHAPSGLEVLLARDMAATKLKDVA